MIDAAARVQMITVSCQQCGARYKLSDDLYAQKGVGFGVIVTCRHCKAEIFVRRPGEISVPPTAGVAKAPVVPRAPRVPARTGPGSAPKADSVPPAALPLTKRKRHLGPPTTDGAELPEVLVDLSDLEPAENPEIEAVEPPVPSRSAALSKPTPVSPPPPLPLQPRHPEARPSEARPRTALFVLLAIAVAGATFVFGFVLRGSLPATSSPAPQAEAALRTLDPPRPTAFEAAETTPSEESTANVAAMGGIRQASAATKRRPEASSGEASGSDAGSDETAGPDASTDESDESAEEVPSEPAEPAGPFDREAASVALGRAASEASSCRNDGDPSGMAAVTITYSPSGRVTTATVAGPPFSGTPTGGCIAATFRKAAIPPFSGELVTVKKTVTIQ
jgi:hypothetical protein